MTSFEQQHKGCVMCGSDNPIGFQLHFTHTEANAVEAAVTIPERFQGYQGVAHGGIVASLLDAAMAHCIKAIGCCAVTGDMNVRYKHPVPIDTQLRLQGILLERSKHLFRLNAQITERQALLATASARFVNAPSTFLQ